LSRLFLFTLLLFPLLLSAQAPKPKLIVGIVIDQMRYDYLERFSAGYGKNGFLRLKNEGSNFTNGHFNYVPTYTAPGHATVYTGTTPHYHGIISNDWYEGTEDKEIYVVDDPAYETVGSSTSAGKSSPHRLKTPTITDQFKIDNPNSRVFSVSIKDRGSVLPGGFMANGAWWFDGKSGNFVTSSYYQKSQPEWAESFNSKQIAKSLMAKSWELKANSDLYRVQTRDEVPWEYDIFKEKDTSFPHDFSGLTEIEKLDKIKTTPFGNEILLQFAQSLITGENIGKKRDADFLAISFSSPDYIGHTFGPNSVEVMDTYIRLDDQISRLLKTLDDQVGKGNYLLFLTADHAVGEAHGFLEENHIPHGYYSRKATTDSLSAYLKTKFGVSDLVINISNNQVFLNHAVADQNKINFEELQTATAYWIRTQMEMVSEIQLRKNLDGKSAKRDLENMILNGWNPARSGDVAFLLRPHFLEGKTEIGATHGSPFRYDTHVPILFYGWNVPIQENNEQVFVVDVAATVADLLHIQPPPACIGLPLIKPSIKQSGH